jgi:hypothetical protein
MRRCSAAVTPLAWLAARGDSRSSRVPLSIRPYPSESDRIWTVSQYPEVLAAERDFDKFAGDPHVAEVQGSSSAARTFTSCAVGG